MRNMAHVQLPELGNFLQGVQHGAVLGGHGPCLAYCNEEIVVGWPSFRAWSYVSRFPCFLSPSRVCFIYYNTIQTLKPSFH